MSNIPMATAVMVDPSGKPPVTGGGSHDPFSMPPRRDSRYEQFVGNQGTNGKDYSRLYDFLNEHQWPRGLQDNLIRSLDRLPIRFMIVDDSGSMSLPDGNKIVGTGNQSKLITCTRWAELTTSMIFHAHLAEAAEAKTEFRLLNSLSPIMLGLGGENDGVNFTKLVSHLKESGPSGGTPLCKHIREVTQEITEIADSLRANGQKAVIVIATDGESSDGDLLTAMRPLQSLPVWVVIKLCTDEDAVVNYWNNIDGQLELDIDVLDDFSAEASEVHENNKWLTYGLPLQRLREFGTTLKEIDLLDETKLTSEQIRSMVSVIFGGAKDDYPHPEVDPAAFEKAVKVKIDNELQTWCPLKKRMLPWVRIEKIRTGGCSIM